MRAKKWLKIFIISTAVTICFIGSFNYIVDPYDAFGNNLFVKYYYKDRITSSIKLEKNVYNFIIVGTSRTQGGISTLNKKFKNKVLNVSMSGSNIFEINKVFDKIYSTQRKNIDIIYGLDFLTFNNKRMPGAQFRQSLYNKSSTNLELYKSLIFSSDATLASLKTSVKTIIGKTSNSHNGYKDKNQNYNYNYKSAFDKILTNNFLVNDGTFNCYKYTKERLNLFEDIVKKSKNRNLHLFITPLHIRHMYAIEQMGLFQIYINWIYDMTKIVDKYNKKPGYNISFYDFSYPNFITTEKIDEDMKYYWESSHYKSSVGDMILEKIFNNDTKFGHKLDGANIHTYLEMYIKDFFDQAKKSEEYYKVFELYQETTKKRVKRCRKYNDIDTILKRNRDHM